MNITILLRYPELESANWKIDLIDRLIRNDIKLTLIFGDKSLFKQFKAVLKEFGFELFKKKRDFEKSGGKNLYKNYISHLPVFKVNNLNSTQSEKIIKSTKPDYLLLLGTGIIRKNILSIPAKGAVHCHHGFLPKYRGVNTAEWNLFYENEVFITTHFVDPGIDTGDILLRKKIKITKTDNIASLRRKCRNESVDLIAETFTRLRNNELTRNTQDKTEGRQYYSMHPFFKELVEKKIERIGE